MSDDPEIPEERDTLSLRAWSTNDPKPRGGNARAWTTTKPAAPVKRRRKPKKQTRKA